MKNITTFFSGIFLTLLVASPLFADDTEIFISAPTATSDRTNVLFGIDTSASMASHVIEDIETDYDPSRDYTNLDEDEDEDDFEPIEYELSNGNERKFDCERDKIYISAWTRNAVVPFQHFIGLFGDFRNEIETDNGRVYLTCAGDFQQNTYIERITAMDEDDVKCEEAQAAIKTRGYFFDRTGACGGENMPVNTRGDGNKRQANYDDNVIFSGNFIAYAYRCVELKDEDACDTDKYGGFITNRLALTKAVVHDILENEDGNEINVGIMRFNSNLTHGMQKIEDYKIRPDEAIKTIDSFPAKDGTPLQNTYYEMHQFFTGKGYTSPITNSCQKNMIVYLTDGTPSSGDKAHRNDILNLTKRMRDADPSIESCPEESGECIPLLAEYMFTQDISGLANYPGSDGIDQIQNIETHTIGFFDTDRGGFAKPTRILTEAAKRGGGTYTQASDTSSLREAFTNALGSVLESPVSFTAPSVSVNNFNRLTNDDELYFTLFQPQIQPTWVGNIKQYKLLNGQIVDTNNFLAVNSETGAFKKTAQSFWTDSAVIDGNEVALGGFASRLTTTRNIYTNLKPVTDTVTGLSVFDLSNKINNVSKTNTALTPLDFNVGNNFEKDNLIDWMHGLRKQDDGALVSTNSIGDPLHSNPIVLSYPPIVTGTGENQTSESDQAIFVGSNTGFLYALDPSTSPGSNMELFSFYPQDMLDRVKTFSENRVVLDTDTKPVKSYGLDGPISSWIEGDNGNGIIEAAKSEKAHIYTTMRRGGKSIYALDVTNRAAPIFEWQITGGDTGFEELGQTWSKVTPAKIPYGPVTNGVQGTKNVLIFAGGYDPSQEANATRKAHTQGRAIYIVDPENGNLLWRAVPDKTDATNSIPQLALPALKYSIPSDIAVIDVNSDGLAERMYVGDLGGQVWRFDILPPDTNASTINVTGGVIADLSSDDSAANDRKFFYRPSISRIADDAFGSHLAIALGSGQRSAPKSTQTNDKFYMIKDPFIFSPKRDNSGIPTYDYDDTLKTTIKDEGNAKNALIRDITNIDNPNFLQIGKFGWSIDLSNSEKVLASAITADNNVFFTTYVPDNTKTNTKSCDPNFGLGNGRLFGVSLFNGKSTLSTADRFVELSAPGIAPAPQVIISEVSGGGGSGNIDPPGPAGPPTADTGSDDSSGGSSDPEDEPPPPPGPVCTVNSSNYNPVLGECSDTCYPGVLNYDPGDGTCPVCENTDPSYNPVLGVCSTCNPSTPGYDVDNGTCPADDCRSTTQATLLVGNQTVVPPICTAPVRTYWHRYDTDPSNL